MILREYCELIVDCEHKTAPTQPTGHPSIRTPNIGRGVFLLDGVNRVSQETYDKWTRRAVPREGDLIMAREAPVGNVAMVPPGLQPCLGQRTLLIRPDRQKVYPRYLQYLLIGPEIQSAIRGQTNGATVPHLNMEDVRALELPRMPHLHEQVRIASILSAYDDLIENCERRIRVLDEMARALYREWFVLFRYPSSPKTTLAESELGPTPSSWQRATVGSVSATPDGVQTGPFGSQLHQSEYSLEGAPVVMPKDLRGFRIDDREIARVPEAVARRLARHRLMAGDIVYGRRGDIGRRAFVMSGDVGGLCGTGCLRIRADRQMIDPWYLFHFLGRDDVAQLIAGRAHGATMPNLNTSLLASVPLLTPPREQQDRFRISTYPAAELRETLFRQSVNLRHSRDILLPRLLSGPSAINTGM